MNVTFVQTADPIFYAPMLQQTSRTVRQFCTRNGFRYESYVGIKRGDMPWHAAYNRVYILKEMVDRGVTGWVFYMDADAYIADMDFDIRQYLSDKMHYAGIFSGFCSIRKPYDINSGGFAINLSHVSGRQLVLDYWKYVSDMPDSAYRRAIVWGTDIPDDQWILFKILEDYWENKRIGTDFLFEQANEGFTNNGPFIRQSLRSKSPTFRARLDAMKSEIARIMAGRRDDRCDDGPGFYLRADHPAIKTEVGEYAFGALRSTMAAGMLMYGPYLPLRAGSYFVGIYGEARPDRTGAAAKFVSDVVADVGKRILSRRADELATPAKGLLAVHRFTLNSATADIEVRIAVDGNQRIDIHAVQILPTDEWVDKDC